LGRRRILNNFQDIIEEIERRSILGNCVTKTELEKMLQQKFITMGKVFNHCYTNSFLITNNLKLRTPIRKRNERFFKNRRIKNFYKSFEKIF